MLFYFVSGSLFLWRKIYEKIKTLSSKVILSREEYNKSISNYREKLKVEAINILEGLDTENKEVAIMLKKTGIISTYDDYDTNNHYYLCRDTSLPQVSTVRFRDIDAIQDQIFENSGGIVPVPLIGVKSEVWGVKSEV